MGVLDHLIAYGTQGKVRVTVPRAQLEGSEAPGEFVYNAAIESLHSEHSYDDVEAWWVGSAEEFDREVTEAPRRANGELAKDPKAESVSVTIPYERPGTRTRFEREVAEENWGQQASTCL